MVSHLDMYERRDGASVTKKTKLDIFDKRAKSTNDSMNFVLYYY